MNRAAVFLASALVLGACTEKPQGVTTRKVDEKPWENASAAYAAPGFKAGDKGAWESQMRSRNQAQNEYNRTATR